MHPRASRLVKEAGAGAMGRDGRGSERGEGGRRGGRRRERGGGIPSSRGFPAARGHRVEGRGGRGGVAKGCSLLEGMPDVAAASGSASSAAPTLRRWRAVAYS